MRSVRFVAWLLAALCALSAPGMAVANSEHKGKVAMETLPGSNWHFEGEPGSRIARNVENWLLRMPDANPGLLDMFHRRDRHLPYPEIVPWAGEFAGKYLISAVQACRMSSDPRVKAATQKFVKDLMACQDSDGYLGPFPHARRLMGDCDLWGHYHCMLGLLMWYDATGDKHAYDSVIRAADCICRLYVDTKRRPIDAGNANFNLSVYHIMAELYKRTGSSRYLSFVRRVEEDLPKDGDWLNKGIAGVPYYQLPGSGARWEALHLLQGFSTMYEATGEVRYKKALLSLWHSIRKYDVHPSGAFSTNEQASGTIFAAGPIETCCSVAWMALTIDALRLTGDPTIADELELTFWNQALAAQHPSGNWCTYDTPLNGTRAPAYQQINFQYRPGSPELNCCSVNAPRSLGMLSDWAMMSASNRSPGSAAAVAVNYYGPGTFDVPLAPGNRLRIVQKTSYPLGGTVHIVVNPQRKTRFGLQLRIPAWSKTTHVTVNGAPIAAVAGSYCTIERTWKSGDTVQVDFELSPRYSVGRGPERAGRAAIHIGPLLLAVDAAHNSAETTALKQLDVSKLHFEKLPAPAGVLAPMGLWRAVAQGGQKVTFCDFASAGATGTDYAAWVPASHMPPPAVGLELPRPGTLGKPGPALLRWSAAAGPEDMYDVLVSASADMKAPIIHEKGLKSASTTVDLSILGDGEYWWQVRTVNAYGFVANDNGPRLLHVSRTAPHPFASVRADGLMLAAQLAGNGNPSFGDKHTEEGTMPALDRHGEAGRALSFGAETRLKYTLPFFPERDYSFIGWACVDGPPTGGEQIFSAWCRGLDDPLRVLVAGTSVSARMEAGSFIATEAVPIERGQWFHVAAVKQGATLTLYVNGVAGKPVKVPEHIHSASTEVGVGYNPNFIGGEHFVGRIADVAFYARALTAEEIKAAVTP